MERLVQYRGKFYMLFWASILLIIILISLKAKEIPDTWVSSNDPHLMRMNGFLYYNNKAFSGYLFSNFANGKRERETPFYEGKEEGLMKSWYADGAKEQERLFVHGNKQGTHHGWWPDGKPKFEYEFTDDEHNGIAKEWFNDNKLYRVFHYTMGHEDGLQQMWWADGTVRANYVVKDGVQYGLIGRKFCKNVFKNEDIKNSNPIYSVTYGLP